MDGARYANPRISLPRATRRLNIRDCGVGSVIYREYPGRTPLAQAVQQILWNKMQLSPKLGSLHLATVDGMEVGYGQMTNTVANDYFLALRGYDRDALAEGHLRWDSLTPPEYVERDQQLVDVLLKQGRLSAVEKDYIHREGYCIPVLIGAVLVSETESFCLVTDMRDRKRAEQALQDSRAFLQRITDTSPNILYVYDLQSKANLYVSGAVQEILGYSVSETMAMGTHFLATLLSPDQLAKLSSSAVSRLSIRASTGSARTGRLRLSNGAGRSAAHRPARLMGFHQEFFGNFSMLANDLAEFVAVDGFPFHQQVNQVIHQHAVVPQNLTGAVEAGKGNFAHLGVNFASHFLGDFAAGHQVTA